MKWLARRALGKSARSPFPPVRGGEFSGGKLGNIQAEKTPRASSHIPLHSVVVRQITQRTKIQLTSNYNVVAVAMNHREKISPNNDALRRSLSIIALDNNRSMSFAVKELVYLSSNWHGVFCEDYLLICAL